MDVSINVILGPDPLLNAIQELDAASPYTCATKVSKPDGWSVGYKDVGVV